MGKVVFKEVDKSNFIDIIKLHKKLSDEHKKCVAPNEFSIAEATLYPDNAFYRGIFVDEVAIGFIMAYIPTENAEKNEENDFFLWRFMIGTEFQSKGYGNQALDILCDLAKEKGFKKILTSCEMVEQGPYPFYKKYGFVENGKEYDHETGLELVF